LEAAALPLPLPLPPRGREGSVVPFPLFARSSRYDS